MRYLALASVVACTLSAFAADKTDVVEFGTREAVAVRDQLPFLDHDHLTVAGKNRGADRTVVTLVFRDADKFERKPQRRGRRSDRQRLRRWRRQRR